MKSYLVALILLILAAENPAVSRADKGGNGGDPMTGQFIIMAKQLAIFYRENPFGLTLPFNPADFSHRVEVLEASLKDFSQRHLVEFTNDKLFDLNNVEKPAVFEDKKDPNHAQIRVNQKQWAAFDNQQRLVQINMEVMGIMKIKNRYQLAENLVKGHVAVIVSIPLPDDQGYHKPGWRVSGQDPDQFGRITEEDFIIDGGSLGLGSALNKRVENFFNNPDQDDDWLSGIVNAWKKGRPGFLLLNTPDGNNASVTAFFPVYTENGIILYAYSLFITKYRQIYSGPCSNDASGLKPVERLKNCYLDLSNYRADDFLVNKAIPVKATDDQINDTMKNLTIDLHENLLSWYADDRDNLSVALRGYYITDYSPTVPSSEIRVKMAAVKAFGLVSSFEGPFDHVPFWKQTGNKDIPSIRLYEATKALAQKDLVFVDSNLRCSAFKGPGLITRQDYDKAKDHCIYTRMGQQFPGNLYQEMVRFGFRYDYAHQNWVYKKDISIGGAK